MLILQVLIKMRDDDLTTRGTTSTHMKEYMFVPADDMPDDMDNTLDDSALDDSALDTAGVMDDDPGIKFVLPMYCIVLPIVPFIHVLF